MVQRMILFGLAVLALAGLLAFVLFGGTPPPSPSASPLLQPLPIPADMEAGFHTPLPRPIRDPRIVVTKSAHRLELFSGKTLLRTFPVGLGMNDRGPKRRQWDLCTPEGRYYVCFKNPNSKYYLALGLNYPNSDDARRGLSKGLISRSQYGAIVEAEARGASPPRNTPLGGDIVIHGRGSGSDWTAGCVALDDDNMRELDDVIAVGTPVVIDP